MQNARFYAGIRQREHTGRFLTAYTLFRNYPFLYQPVFVDVMARIRTYGHGSRRNR